MAIYLTGDVHAEVDVRKLTERCFAPEGLTREDYLIILGDFGFVWDDPPTKRQAAWLDWFDSRPWTTLFVDGNHENHVLLATFPREQWHGGQVQRIRENLLHLCRGEVFEINGKGFFVMGGAASLDKDLRTPYVSWWPQEVPSEEERSHALAMLEAANWKVDYVLTHCPPTNASYLLLPEDDHWMVVGDEYMDWLQAEVADKLDFKRWFYGHMHVDFPDAEPFTPLFDAVVELKNDGSVEVVPPLNPLFMNQPKHPAGYSAAEIAEYEGCAIEEVDAVIDEVMQYQTVGLHPKTGERLIYPQDLWQIIRHLETP